jgi:hypothetical protein
MNQLSGHLSKNLREVFYGGNWTSVNLRDSLVNVTCQQAVAKFYSLNSILALVYHINYYITAVTKVLEGEPLNASDKFSFNHPVVDSEQDWQNLLNKTWSDAEKFASLIEQLPDSKLWENFEDGKYGNYYRNIQGIIEHSHYHLGQIVLIKKLLQLPA